MLSERERASATQLPRRVTPPALLRELLDELPDELARPVFTHASWTARRSDSYERLAFLGDSVLALAVTSHLYPAARGRALRPRPADQDPRPGGVGPLVPRGRRAARRARAPARRGAGRRGHRRCAALVATERVLASVIEAVIGACYLAFGYETHRRGGRRGVLAGDRGRARASGRLQVRAAGAARAQGRARDLRRGRRGGPAARPDVLGQRDDRRRRGRPRAGAAARRTPSRRPRRRRWRRWNDDGWVSIHVPEIDRRSRASSRSRTAPGSSSARASA